MDADNSGLGAAMAESAARDKASDLEKRVAVLEETVTKLTESLRKILQTLSREP